MGKKLFFFCMTVCHRRTGAPIGNHYGVVWAGGKEEAEHIAWDKYGNNFTCNLWVEEITGDSYELIVY